MVRRVEANMYLDPKESRIKVSYPFKPEVSLQASNYNQVVAIQEGVEKRVIRDGLLDQYTEEMQKAIDAGSVVKLRKEDLKEWEGPIH